MFGVSLQEAVPRICNPPWAGGICGSAPISLTTLLRSVHGSCVGAHMWCPGFITRPGLAAFTKLHVSTLTFGRCFRLSNREFAPVAYRASVPTHRTFVSFSGKESDITPNSRLVRSCFKSIYSCGWDKMQKPDAEAAAVGPRDQVRRILEPTRCLDITSLSTNFW